MRCTTPVCSILMSVGSFQSRRTFPRTMVSLQGFARKPSPSTHVWNSSPRSHDLYCHGITRSKWVIRGFGIECSVRLDMNFSTLGAKCSGTKIHGVNAHDTWNAGVAFQCGSQQRPVRFPASQPLEQAVGWVCVRDFAQERLLLPQVDGHRITVPMRPAGVWGSLPNSTGCSIGNSRTARDQHEDIQGLRFRSGPYSLTSVVCSVLSSVRPDELVDLG